jgi:hypothetical protein
MSTGDESWIRLASGNRDQGVAIFDYEMARHARLLSIPAPPAVPQAQSSSFSEEAGRFMRSVAKDGDDDEA